MENNNLNQVSKNAESSNNKKLKQSPRIHVSGSQKTGAKPRPSNNKDIATSQSRPRHNDSSAIIKAIGSYVQCSICSKLCSRQGHIKCAECIDFNICIKCFCSGLEKPDEEAMATSFVDVPVKNSESEHRNTHKYIPVGPSNFALFSKDWSAEQELLLVDAISKYGLGNWTEVSDMVTMSHAGYQTDEECERHYYQHYLNSPTAPYPDTTSLVYDDDGKPYMVPYRGTRPALEKPKPVTTNKPQTKPQVVGYWPLRGDFDIEYDNDAELILADMEFRPDDTPDQINLKLNVIEIYNSKLDERLYRKKVIIERGLLDNKTLQQKEKKMTLEEKELYHFFKPFMRFQTPQEHDHMIQLMIKERKLRTKLYQLMAHRVLGLEEYDQILNYEDRLMKVEFFRDAITKQRESDKSRRHERRLRTSSFENEVPATSYPDKFNIYEYLEENELEFCDALDLPPFSYFMAKRILLQEMANNPMYTIDDMCSELRIDGTKQGRIFDFLLMLSPKALRSMEHEVADLNRATLDKNGFVDTQDSATQITLDTSVGAVLDVTNEPSTSVPKGDEGGHKESQSQKGSARSSASSERPSKHQKTEF